MKKHLAVRHPLIILVNQSIIFILFPDNHQNLRNLDDSYSSHYNPCNETLDEDPDNTMNSDCNVTVIHVPLKANNNHDSASSDVKYEDDTPV